jgi:hypothetical protein
MADIALDTQGTPTTPSAGVLIAYADSGSKQLTAKNDAGRVVTIPGIKNWNTADVVANAADTYLTGSSVAIPQHLMQAGTTFRWRFVMTKTAAGVAAPVWSVRVGTAGTTADSARLTFTGPAQTAAVDTAIVQITAVLRNTGAAGVLTGGLVLTHNLATTGFANIGSPTLQVTSGTFDTTVASLIVGVSVSPGSAGVWTHQLVIAEALNV